MEDVPFRDATEDVAWTCKPSARPAANLEATSADAFVRSPANSISPNAWIVWGRRSGSSSKPLSMASRNSVRNL